MAPSILVSPQGYDNVQTVLGQLAGRFTLSGQLTDVEFEQLPDHLSDCDHLFLNCAQRLIGPFPNAWLQAIREFVDRGGSIYASDWASAVLEAAFPQEISFRRGGVAGRVQVQVKDQTLAARIGRRFTVEFDMDDWHCVDACPLSTDVYLFDQLHRKVAFGFTVGRGRVVYTSYHHVAQVAASGSVQSPDVDFLRWLVLLPTQHRSLTAVSSIISGAGATALSAPTMGMLGPAGQELPLHLARRMPGLGVFTVAWESDVQRSVRLRYRDRAGRNIANTTSSRSPLVLHVRDPGIGDSVDVSWADAPPQDSESMPFSFQGGIRRGVLASSTWLPGALLRHLARRPSLTQLREDAIPRAISDEGATASLVAIMTGLGYAPGEVRCNRNERGSVVSVRREGADRDDVELLVRVSLECTRWVADLFETVRSDYSETGPYNVNPTERFGLALVLSRLPDDDLVWEEEDSLEMRRPKADLVAEEHLDIRYLRADVERWALLRLNVHLFRLDSYPTARRIADDDGDA